MSEFAEKLKEKTVVQDVPEEVSAWLGRLVLLYGIPFHYLVPEQEMLPSESIRFFYLDPVWIQSLAQGACSVGNTDYGDTVIDDAMNSLVQPSTSDSAKNANSVTTKSAAGVRDRLREQYEGIDVPEESRDLAWPLTGFLLRSSVVRGWRGLEIMAYRTLADAEKKEWVAKKLNDDDQVKLKDGLAPLQALRIEQLSADIMLGIFNGKITQLVIRQPQESLHFGLTRTQSSFNKKLRSLGYKDPARAGEILQGNVIDFAGKNLMRDQSQEGVINIAELAAQIESQLDGAGELSQTDDQNKLKRRRFTSAEFAVEMIEAAGEFTFTVRI